MAGGRERLLHDMDGRAGVPADATARERLARTLHATKNRHYATLVAAGAVQLRPGVRELIDDCAAAGVALAIATTTSRVNVDVLLASQLGPSRRRRFAVVLCAEDASAKKPDPQVYLAALRQLDCRADEVLAIEDSPAGAAACRAADVPVVVTRSHYFAAVDVGAVAALGPGLQTCAGWAPAPAAGSRIDLPRLRAWHDRASR